MFRCYALNNFNLSVTPLSNFLKMSGLLRTVVLLWRLNFKTIFDQSWHFVFYRHRNRNPDYIFFINRIDNIFYLQSRILFFALKFILSLYLTKSTFSWQGQTFCYLLNKRTLVCRRFLRPVYTIYEPHIF